MKLTTDLSDADYGHDTCDGTDHECSHDVPADWEPEDQITDCYWDASEQGNGQGEDFIVFDGRVWYDWADSYGNGK